MNYEALEMEPANYYSNNMMFDIDFHPTGNFIACSSIDGEARILKYDNEDTVEVFNKQIYLNGSSCRTVKFNKAGNCLATGGQNGGINVLNESGISVCEIPDAHSLHYLNDTLLASGDDNGEIKVWDLRTKQVMYSVDEQKDGTITGLTTNSNKTMMLATSDNGYLGVYDLRKENTSKNKLYALSDQMEEEYNDVLIVRDEGNVVCPTSTGALAIYKWDDFGDCKNRVPLGIEEANSVVKKNESLLFVGGEDGWIRIASLLPPRVRAFKRHAEDLEEATSITRLSISHCNNYLASLGFDMSINFYDISQIEDLEEEISASEDDQTEKFETIDNYSKNDKKRTKKINQKAQTKDFLSDL